jgi:hypothetical protein
MEREHVHDPAGDYVLAWHCTPPPYHKRTIGEPTFIVTRDHWDLDADPPERHIYSWKKGRAYE